MRTIKDIAQIAKVSTGTVDRVLHNRGGVSKKTEAKIKKLIEESGFTPNLIARNLVLNKEYKVAVLIPSYDTRSPFWKLPKKGIKKGIKEVSTFGMQVNVFYFDQYDVSSFEEKLDEIIEDSEVDGIILAPSFTKETIRRRKKLDDSGIPYLFINVDLKGFNNISFVGQDSFKSGYLAAKLFHVTQAKDTTVLVMDVQEDMDNHYGLDSRIKGFTEFFNQNSSSLRIEKLKIPKYDDEHSITKALTKALIANNQIKGIFVPSIKVNVVASYLRNFEIEMQTVVGYDLTDENANFVKMGVISFLIHQEPLVQGYKSIKLMFDHLVNNMPLESQYLSPIQIILKENLEYYV